MKTKILILLYCFVIGFSAQINILSKTFKGAEYRTKLSYTYGRFEVRMKSAYRDGMLASFFTYYDGGGGIENWNEIDIEIMGRYFDNVQFNTITPNQTNHVGHQPMLTSPHQDYHTYAFEWTPDYVTWFIDGVEVLKQTGAHIQTLTRAQKIMMNVWNPLFENWAGLLNPESLPAFAYYDWVSYYAYTPGSGTYGTGNNFTHDWTDDFDFWDTTRWDKATHTWNENGCDFIQANAVFNDGKLVLCLTNSTNTGFVDVQPPALVWARASTNKVLVMFSEELNQTDAENISNYAIAGITINNAVLQPDRKNVELSVTGLIIPSAKTLVVLSMKDDEAIPNTMSAKATSIIMPQTLTFPAKINCGGPAALDYLADVVWSKDTEFGFLDGSIAVYPSTLQINGTNDDVIYQSDKYGMVGYKIRVPNGNYIVKLLFAEKYFDSAGSRVFDVYIEQNRVITNLDIYALVGKNAAYVKQVTNIQIIDGILDIQFADKIDNALICGIEIIQVSTGLLDDGNVIEPKSFKVEQNYPNPFNGKTIINYSVAKSENLSFELFNSIGQSIYSKDLGLTQSGSHQLQLDTAALSKYPLSSGIYFYVFTGGNNRAVKKLVLLN
ncbi:MAG: malectin domain-containing carbohydrate-binding protein [Ignavibacteriota bacterium]